jgi:DNA-binding NarL/FixJ family response regulator
VRRAFDAGVDGYLPKAAADEDLVRAIRAVAELDGADAHDQLLGDLLVEREQAHRLAPRRRRPRGRSTSSRTRAAPREGWT